jgi:hypothetical protein
VRSYGAGGHSFAVRGTDAQGNVEGVPARAAFRVVPTAAPPAADIAALTVAALRTGARSLASKLGKHGIRTLRRNGAAYSFAAPSAGRLTITLKAGKRTLASVSRSASKAGTLRGRLKGTKKARAGVLKKSKRLRATLTMRFTPTGGARRASTGKLTLKR